MGTWKIEISGHGCHHNRGRKEDAERLAARFVEQLTKAGHVVRGATFTLTGMWDIGEVEMEGTKEDVTEWAAYLAAKEAADAGAAK